MGDPGGGYIPEKDVVGKVFVTVWPVDRWHFFHRPATFDNPALNEAVGVVRGGASAGLVVLLTPPLYRRWALRRERKKLAWADD